MDDNNCPMCGSIFLPDKRTSPELFLSNFLLMFYRGFQEDYSGEISLPCPRCGEITDTEHDVTFVSRYEDIQICEKCNVDETEREDNENILPISDWHIVSMILHSVK